MSTPKYRRMEPRRRMFKGKVGIDEWIPCGKQPGLFMFLYKRIINRALDKVFLEHHVIDFTKYADVEMGWCRCWAEVITLEDEI